MMSYKRYCAHIMERSELRERLANAKSKHGYLLDSDIDKSILSLRDGTGKKRVGCWNE